MTPKRQTGIVRKEWPPIGATVEGHGIVIDFSHRRIPIVRPEGAILGHMLPLGENVKIILPPPKQTDALTRSQWENIALDEGVNLS